MKKYLLILIFLSLLLSKNSFGYNSLRVGDPRNSWSTYQGTIEEAVLSVKPKGIYMEYGLYLTFSARGTYYTANDSLEITFNFNLPENAIVYDSWLWVGNDIIRAKILDKWTASLIYENNVKRRVDPSILTKQSSTQYQLKVFPMMGNQTRKVKITFLMPAEWSKEKVAASLPLELLTTSLNELPKLHLFTWTDSLWNVPSIKDVTELNFQAKTDTVFGDYLTTEISSSYYNSKLKISFNTPLKNGYYLSKYSTGGNEGIYQLALLPSPFVDSTAHHKVAVLFDYDASNTTISVSELLLKTKNEMIENLSSKDSFNLIFSNLSIYRVSNYWLPADSLTIENTFNALTNPLSSYSNLTSLLSNGIDFIKNNDNNGEIVLISSSDQFGEYQNANTLINDILKLMNPSIPIHIADFQDQSFAYYYIGSTYYYGNEYFYLNLSRITGGSFQRIRDGYSLSEIINLSFKYLSGTIKSFDLYTKLTTGICYSRYNLNASSDIAYINTPILQIGKYKGSFPFIAEFSGEYNSALFSKTINISEPITSDSLNEEMWTGCFIKNLESQQQSNDIINEIIYNSLAERVLSIYTAFLCLEDTNLICHNCKDETNLVSVEENDMDSLTTVYPNPFVDEVKISINSRSLKNNEIIEIKVYNITGELVYYSVPEISAGLNRLDVKWNGKNINGNPLPAGMYILMVLKPDKIENFKLIKQ
ncbi:MAG: VIT domain-containing protein [Bacteroidales bacterium]|nr:VIT domain-containing protein [Bacteroidales bacterium]